MSTGTIEKVDPTTLTIALNVRSDARLDKAFVASIKELGVLQPPMVTRAADGALEVVLGQRRTLAAVEAGLTEIPVYVVDQSEADAARVIDQLTENDQRQSLTEAERVAGYKTLALFGVSPAQIAKRTSTDRKRVDTALAVADNDVAREALTEYELTLDEAAYLVEFSDDDAVVKNLVKAAGNGDLAHVVAAERRKRDLARLEERLAAELVAEKVIVMLPSSSSYGGAQEGDPEGLVRLDKLGSPKDATVPLDVKEVPKKALAGRVVTDYMNIDGAYGRSAVKQYFVLNPAEHGIPAIEYARPEVELTEEQLAARAEREEAERAAAELRSTRAAVAEVRWAFVAEFMQRKTLPVDEALAFVARVTALADLEHSPRSFALLGVEVDNFEALEVVEKLLTERPQDALKVILASVLASAEGLVNPSASWRTPVLEVASLYLTQLDSWGYGLSEYEHSLLEQATLAASVEDVDDDSDDDEYYDEEGYGLDGEERDDE